jgi:hypothetical protein
MIKHRRYAHLLPLPRRSRPAHEFSLAEGRVPLDIAAAGDGTLWFTERGANLVGRLTREGQVTEFPIPTRRQRPARHRPHPRRTCVVRRGKGRPTGPAAHALLKPGIESIRDIDPKTNAEIIGGSKDGTGKLGLAYRKPSRW